MNIEDRFQSIERRLSALEKHRASPSPHPPCKRCGSYERNFVSSKPDPIFQEFGATIDTYECSDCKLEFAFHNKDGL